MNPEQFLTALNEADDAYIQQAGLAGGHFSSVRRKQQPRLLIRILLAAAIILTLSATVYAGGEIIGIWNDRWLYTANTDPVEVVREAVSRQKEKDYTVSVTVEELRIDEEETRRILAGDRSSILAMTGGWGPSCQALAEQRPEDVKAVYARYTVTYDHTKTFYRDGTLYQYFYLIRNPDGTWEVYDSTDGTELNPVLEPVPEDSRAADSEEVSHSAESAGTAAVPSDLEGAIRTVTAMILNWEAFEDVDHITVEDARFDPERTRAAAELLRGSTLAAGNGWTEEYLKNHMAAVTVTWITREKTGGAYRETATYWLLQDPATGAWHNSEITGFMEAEGQ